MSIEVLPLSVRGLRPETRKIDRDLWLWFCEAKRDSEHYHGPRVTKRLVQAKAKQAFEAAGICNFKASDGWYFRWLKRWHRVDINNAKSQLKNRLISSNAQVPKKEVPRKPRPKTPKALIHGTLRKETTDRSYSAAGSDTCRPKNTSGLDYFSSSIISNLCLEVPASVSGDLSQIFDGNNTDPNVFSLPLNDNSVLQKQFLCGDASNDFANSFLCKDYIVLNEAEPLEPMQVDEHFTPDSPSFANVDDFSWSDLSDLPCFGRPVPTKLLQAQPAMCPSKTLLAVAKPEEVLNQQNFKIPVKGKGKFYFSQNSMDTVALNSSSAATPEPTIAPTNQRLFMKGKVNLPYTNPCSSQFLPEVKSSKNSHGQFLGNSMTSRCGKKSSFSAKNVNPLRMVPVKQVFNLGRNVIAPDPEEESKEACTPQLGAKGPLLSLKNSSKFYFSQDKAGSVSNRDIDFRLTRPCGKGKKGNLFSHSVVKESLSIGVGAKCSDFEETSCGNFVQHDLEDVSLSSDFVNHLNDENSFDLALAYGNENLSHLVASEMSMGRVMNSNSDLGDGCDIDEPVLSGFIDLIASTPEIPEPGCHPSVADEELSGDENDYISEAVMLSMQEDDFSILDCDQSPFQGTISVIDENSQSECDKIKDLDEGTQAALLLEEHGFQSGEIQFPPNGPLESNSLHQGAEVSALHQTLRNEVLKESSDQNSAQKMPSIGLSGPNYEARLSQDQECFICSNPSTEQLCKSQNELFLTSSSRNEDTLQNCISLNDVSASGILEPPVQGCTINVEEQHTSSNNADLIVGGGNMFEISSSVSEGALVGGHNLLQISSSGEFNTLITDKDVILTCYNDVEKSKSMSSKCFSAEGDSLHESEKCSGTPSVEDASSIYFLPCASEKSMDLNVGSHFDASNFILDNGVMDSDDQDVTSQPDMTNAHADSTVLLTPSAYSEGSNVTEFITMSTPNTFVLTRTSQVPRSCDVTEDPRSSALSLDSADSNSLSNVNVNVTCQYGPSSSPNICESSKENGFVPYDLQLVESVLSEQDDAPGNSPKCKTVAYLTEKGSNVGKTGSVQTSNRPLSGDRYYPFYKEKVVSYALKHTAKEAAHFYGVNVDTVTMWTKKRHGTNVVKSFPDQHMLKWLKKNRENRVILTREQIAEKAVELLKTPDIWMKSKSRWFHIWASRLVEDEEKKKMNGNCGDRGDKKALYPEEFKVEVALYAEQTSRNLASSIFKIARKRVCEWSVALKAAQNNEKVVDNREASEVNCQSAVEGETITSNDLSSSQDGRAPKKFKLNGKGMGRAVTSTAVDHELWLWFCDQTAKKSKPKSKEIQAKAIELFRAHNHDKIKCSHGWLKKWSLRYGIALRHEGDSDLVAWCLEQFDHNRNISHRDLLTHAHKSLTGTHKSEFKASAGWLVRFCKRHRDLLSTKPSIDLEIPTPLKQKVSEFRFHVQNIVHSSNIALDGVGCLDEIPLNFTSGGPRSRLLLRRSGLENCHAIVVLSCLASGKLLPPAIIFKGEGPAEQVTHDNAPVHIFYEKDCCMTDSIMLRWLESVWIKHVSGSSVLVTDCYEAHCSKLVQEKCKSLEVSLSIIPAGCSYKLQPLDLAVSQIFEANIHNRWTRHFSTMDEIPWTCKRTPYSSNSDVVRWVAEAYNSLKEARKEAIQRSFLVTGLTSSLSGSDDHLIEDHSFLPFSSLFTSQP